ncbi:hypothetical protein TNCV_1254971 [Trichonephila clavipes]|nr:hypothetical protein TNCV_1254971 [Trichonephila clavipes]
MRQARHLLQRWYWSIVLQVWDVIRQITPGTPNCNTNPKATVFGIPKEPILESSELITSRLTGVGSLLPPVYGEAWTKGQATGTPDSTFHGTGRRTRQTCGSDSKTSLNIFLNRKPPRASMKAAIRRDMESNRRYMSTCGREFHVVCISTQSSSFEAVGHRSRMRRRPTKSHTCSIGDISDE